MRIPGGGFNANSLQQKLNQQLNTQEAENKESRVEQVEAPSEQFEEDQEQVLAEEKRYEQILQEDAVETDNKLNKIRQFLQLGSTHEDALTVTNESLRVQQRTAQANNSAAAAAARLRQKQEDSAAGKSSPWDKYYKK